MLRKKRDEVALRAYLRMLVFKKPVLAICDMINHRPF